MFAASQNFGTVAVFDVVVAVGRTFLVSIIKNQSTRTYFSIASVTNSFVAETGGSWKLTRFFLFCGSGVCSAYEQSINFRLRILLGVSGGAGVVFLGLLNRWFFLFTTGEAHNEESFSTVLGEDAATAAGEVD